MAFAHSFAQIMINIYSMGPLLVTELNKDSTKLMENYLHLFCFDVSCCDWFWRERVKQKLMFAIKKIATIAAPDQQTADTTRQTQEKLLWNSIRKFDFFCSMCVIYTQRTGCWYLLQEPPRLYCLCSDGIALYQGVRRVCLMFACRDLGWCRLAMSPLVLYPLAGLVRFC